MDFCFAVCRDYYSIGDERKMNCPECNESGVKTLDTRSYVDEEQGFYYVERKRVCNTCGYKYMTIEVDIEVWHTRRSENGGDT